MSATPSSLTDGDLPGMLRRLLRQHESGEPLPSEPALEGLDVLTLVGALCLGGADFAAWLVGFTDPALGKVLNNIGAVQLSRFDLAAAEQTYNRALALLRAAHGDDHPSLATVHSNLGLIAFGQARFPRAIAEFQRALATYEASLPADHPNIGDCLQDLGDGYLAVGQASDAVATFERALAVFERAFGVGHERTTRALARLGAAQLRADRDDAAAASFARALAEHRGPASDPALGHVRAGVGALRLRAGRHAQAVVELEAALELLGAATPAHELAEVQFTLARALAAADRPDLARARRLAGDARAGLLGFGAALIAGSLLLAATVPFLIGNRLFNRRDF